MRTILFVWTGEKWPDIKGGEREMELGEGGTGEGRPVMWILCIIEERTRFRFSNQKDSKRASKANGRGVAVART